MEGTIGEIRMFGGTFAPLYWAFCDGSLQSIEQNPGAYAVIGTTYGGDGIQTFALPDLRGRVPVGVGQGAGLSYVALGEKGGEESHTLLSAEMAAHTHSAVTSATGTINVSAAAGTTSTPAAGNSIAAMVTGTGRSAVQVNAFNTDAPNTALSAGSALVGGSMVVTSAGNGQPHSNMQPSIALQYIICLEGIYPSRN